MVTSTGMIMPSGSLAVLALNCLQKSMMFTPCGPSAVPTGGAGVAFIAGNCNFTVALIFLAILLFLYPWKRLRVSLRDFFNLRKIELDWRGTPEDGYRNLQRRTVGIHLFHYPGKIAEEAFSDSHFLATIERQLLLRFFRRGGGPV